MDQNLLEAVRQWLEPLSDKSLPALNIQNAFFEVLPKVIRVVLPQRVVWLMFYPQMDIDTNTLKESGIGRIVMFYTRSNKRVTPTIKRAADALLAQWSRPIIKRSSSYRDRAIATGTIDPSQQRRAAKLNAILAKGREEDAGKVRKNAVRIPERSLGTYTVAPKHAATSASTQRLAEDMEKRKFQNDRVRKVQRKLDQHRQKSSKQ